MCEGSFTTRRNFLEGCFVVSTVVTSGAYLWFNNSSSQRFSLVVASDVEGHLNGVDILSGQHLDFVGDEAGLTLAEIKQKAKISPDVDRWLLEHAQKQVQTQDHANLEQQPLTVTEEAKSDVILTPNDLMTVEIAAKRLAAVRDYVGFGNFNLIGWDDLLAYARNIDSIGAFSAREIGLMEDFFARDADTLQFYGERTGFALTDAIQRDQVIRDPRSGHFLIRGSSAELFQKMQNDIGETLILTSGVRGVPKQFDLFFERVRRHEGNLTRACSSLAPPGYSFHAIGDFDVGKYGLGLANFTAAFAETEEFAHIQKMPEVQNRYYQDNRFGVRFEPWHIRVS